jgi:peptidyl-tRNA hydrolase
MSDNNSKQESENKCVDELKSILDPDAKKNKKKDDVEYKMYIFINNDLGMKKGKIAGQACHAVTDAIRFLERSQYKSKEYSEWFESGQRKIVLKTTFRQMEQVLSMGHDASLPFQLFPIHDAGKTQIPADSLTAIATTPFLSKDLPKFIEEMQLKCL